MKYIIISDIHSNLEALEAVVRSFPPREDSKILCAGDIVGYGADPGPCIDMCRSMGLASVRGNHDAAVIDKTNIFFFNGSAVRAVLWTKKNLDPSGKDLLEGLPLVITGPDITVVHGTLHQPEEFLYMITESEAARTFKLLKGRICFVGHSHVPGVYSLKDGKIEYACAKRMKMDKDGKYIVNVGSVGQPRDSDNRACYCVYDTEAEEIEFRRIEYDIQKAHDKIIKAGLPSVLGERLHHGI